MGNTQSNEPLVQSVAIKGTEKPGFCKYIDFRKIYYFFITIIV